MQDLKKANEELERKLMAAQEQLLVNENDIMKYRLANDAMGIGLWDMDILDGNFANPDNVFMWSQEFRNMLGFSDENDFPNILGSWSSRLHPDDHDRTFAAAAAHINDRTGKTPFDTEYRLQLKNGEYRHFHALGTTRRDGSGTPLRIAGTLRDITERKLLEAAAQHALEESERAVSIVTSVLNQSGAMIYVADPDTDEILFMTDSMRIHCGIEGDVIGQPCYQILQDNRSRCDFCPCSALEKDPDMILVREEHYTRMSGYYRKVDRYIDWPGGKKVRIQYITDLTDIRQVQETLAYRERLVGAFNTMDLILLSQKDKTFDDVMGESLRPIADATQLDRIDIYSFVNFDGGKRLGQVYRWIKTTGGLTVLDENFRVVPFLPVVESWVGALSKGEVVNLCTSTMTPDEFAFLNPISVKAVLFVPVHINDELWGVVAFQDFVNDRLFEADSIGFLSTVARFCADAIIKNRIKNELDLTSERMRLMMDSAPLCCQLWDSTFRVIDCNSEAVRLFGFQDKADFLERYPLLYPEFQPDGERSADKIDRYLRKTVEEGWSTFDWTFRMLDGTSMPAEAVFVRVDYGDDFAITGYTRDLREHNRLMSEINQRTEELTLQRSTLQTIIDSIPDLVFCKDLDMRYSLVNIACREFLNTDMEGIIGKNDVELNFPENVQKAMLASDIRIFGGEPKVVYDDWIPSFDGESQYFETTKAPLIQDGVLVGLVGISRDITLAHERDQALMHAHQLNELQLAKLGLVVKGTKIGLWDAELEGDDVISPLTAFNWSDDFRRMLGFTDESDFPNVIDSWRDRLHPEDRERVLEALTGHLSDTSGGTVYDTEFRLKKKDGEYGYFRAAGETIRDEKGGAVRIAGALIDISDMKQMTLALNDAVLESQKTIDIMSSILNNTDAMIYVSDKDTYELLFVNDYMKQHFGIVDDVAGKYCYQVFNTIKNEKCAWCPRSRLARAPDNALTWEMHHEMTDRYYRNTDRYIDWPGGKKVHIQHSVDLTDIIEMQDELSHNQTMLHAINSAASLLLNSDIDTFESALYKSMQSLAEILDIDRIWIWKNSTVEGQLYCSQLYTWSGRVETVYGEGITANLSYSEALPGWEEVLGAGVPINTLSRDLSWKLQSLMSLQGALSLLVVPVFAEEQFWGFVSFDSCYAERVFANNEVYILGSGSVLFVNACIRNEMLKSQRETSTRLEFALDEAKYANKAKGDFLRTVSHEIRTPMNVILGLTEIQLQSEVLANGVRQAFDRIHTASDLLLGIINDILDMSKIEAGKLEVVPEVYEMASLISDTVQTNIDRRGSNPVDFRLHVDENIPTLLVGDPLRIKQILNNLLSNSFKYTESGQVSLSFYTEPGTRDSEITLVIEVSDTGQGMTEEELGKLFEMYTRFNLELNQTIAGTGLGMSIMKNLLELMHGEVEVESAPGKGSRFVVRLPQDRGGSQVLGEELANNLQRFNLYGGKQMKRVQITREPMPYGSVLIVDDMESNLHVARGLLVPYGLQIDVAKSGFEAIEKIESGKVYDIVFMDHMMPKMDGMEASKRIRDKGYTHPIVALTANAVAGQAEVFLQSGFDEFISKPIDLRQLNSVLNRFIRDRYLVDAAELVEAARAQLVSALKNDTDRSSSDTSVTSQTREVFIRDVSRSLAALESINTKPAPWSEEDKNMYEVHVHGMKTALAIIGNRELSGVAYKLEMTGTGGDMALLQQETADFLKALRAVIQDFVAEETSLNVQTQEEDEVYLREQLLVIRAACMHFDSNTVVLTVRKLREKSWSQSAHNLLATISRYLLGSDFDAIVDAVDGYLDPGDE